MVKSEPRVTIKRYANRRLYHTGSGTYVTAEDIASMAENDEDVVVYDAGTGADITAFILAKTHLH
jgi:polyhydroxyalkanoate synthesis regulator protein